MFKYFKKYLKFKKIIINYGNFKYFKKYLKFKKIIIN